jgi:hypothetical protein
MSLEPLGGGKDAISCRLTFRHKFTSKLFFEVDGLIYGNGDLREGSVRRGPGQGTEGEGRVSGDGRRRRRSWRNEQEAEMSGDPGTGRAAQAR